MWEQKEKRKSLLSPLNFDPIVGAPRLTGLMAVVAVSEAELDGGFLESGFSRIVGIHEEKMAEGECPA